MKINRFSLLVGLGLVFLSQPGALLAQDSLRLYLRGAESQPVSYATVLLTAPEQDWLRGNYTDERGYASLPLPTGADSVTLTVSHLDFSADTLRLALGELARPLVRTLAPRAYLTEMVTVAATRPVITRRADRLVLPVAGTNLATGESAYSILNYAPGVRTDSYRGLTLNGRGDVLVIVDERVLRLRPEEVASYLAALPATAVQQVEVMVNPPAEYAAEGTGGVIRIVTDPAASRGWELNLGTYGQLSRLERDVYPSAGANVGLTGTRGKWSYRSLYVYDRTASSQRTTGVRGEPTERVDYAITLDQNPEVSHLASLGGALQLDDRRRIYLTLDQRWRNLDADILSLNRAVGPAGAVSAESRSDYGELQRTTELDGGYSFGSGRTQRLLTANAYLSYADERARVDNFINPDETAAVAEQIDNSTDRSYRIFSGQSKNTLSLADDRVLEYGARYGEVRTGSLTGLRRDGVSDARFNGDFDYRERVVALYTKFDHAVSEKFQWQAGLRSEWTTVRTRGGDSGRATQDYLNLFPSASLSYLPGDNNQLSLSYNYRIQRPNYEDLNPFLQYVDPYLITSGNGQLQPAYAHSLELGHLFAGLLYSSLTYQVTDGLIDDVLLPGGPDGAAVERALNLGQRRELGLGTQAVLQPREWWQATTALRAYRATTGLGAEFTGQPALRIVAGELQTQHTFTLPGGWRSELSLVYLTPFNDGAYEVRSVTYASAMVGRRVLGDRGRIKLEVNDLFNSYRIRGALDYPGFRNDFQSVNTFRYAKLSFRLNLSGGKEIELPDNDKSNQEQIERLEN